MSDEKEKSRGLREDVEKMQSELEEASEKARMQSETEATLGNKVEALQFEITIKDNLAQELESRYIPPLIVLLQTTLHAY